VIPYEEKGAIGNNVSEDISRYSIVHIGDIVMNSMNVIIGSVGLSKYDGALSPVYYVLQPVNKDQMDMRYFAYHFGMPAFYRQLARIGYGILEHRMRIPWINLQNELMFVPPIAQQKAIADYLDQETARIDALIEKKQQMCDLVQLRRRALVELYLGEASFPKWKFGRLLISNDGGVWGEDPSGVDDTVVLRSTDISITGDWNIDNPALRSLTQSEKRAKTLKQGDLVVVKSSGSEAHLGKTAIVNGAVADLGACYANFVQRLRPRDTKDAKFLWYFLNSDLASKELDRLGNTTTGLRNLNGESLGSIKCPWPDHEIRNTLCQELDRRIVTSNSLLSALEGQIALLRERRQALITAAVTGELEIPGVVA
jgi:restriction endonuclease S subunit